MDDQHALGWSLAVDCRITRRKYYHLIVAPDGQVVFRSKLLGAALDYFDAIGVDQFEIVSDSYRRLARIGRAGETARG